MEPDRRALNLARHYLETDRPQNALQALGRITSMEAWGEELCSIRAAALVGLERYRDARSVLQRGLQETPESTSLLSLLCRCETELGNLPGAERLVLAALRLDAEDAYLLCQYADLCARAGQLQKARGLIERAMRIVPDSRGLLAMRAKLAYLTGDDRGLLADSERILGEDPDNLAGHAFRGTALAEKGQVDDAARHMRHVAVALPGDAEAAETAREGRLAAHWLLWPLRPLHRYSPGVIWFAVVGVLLLLAALQWEKAVLAVALLWVAYCVYSWTMPHLVRCWLRRRRP